MQQLRTIHTKSLVTNADEIDITAFEEQLCKQEGLQKVFSKSAELGADLFTALYRLRPQLKSPSPKPALSRVLSEVMQTSEYHKLHNNTALDDVLSAGASVALRRYLKEDKAIEKALNSEQRVEELKMHIEQAKEVGNKEHVKQLRETLKREQEQAAQAMQALENKTMKPIVSHAVRSAREQIENAQHVAAGWGDEQANLQEMFFDKKLADLISSQSIKRMLNLAGRMIPLIAAQRALKPLEGPDKVEIVCGRDIANLVPSELALLSDPETENIFYKKYVEGSLLSYKREEKPKLGKGPFIICIDESGSTESGAIQTWEKAFAWALCLQAHRERRKFAIVSFSTMARSLYDPATPQALLEFLSKSLGGGTDFDLALQEGMKMMQRQQFANDGDIIFITDGEAEAGKDTVKALSENKRALGFKVIGVRVGAKGEEAMKEFCDTVLSLQPNADNVIEIVELM